jgi:hypothetical protein
MGRFFRPGVPCQAAIGNQLPQQVGKSWTDLGELGRFHTFELPQIEFFGLTAGAITYSVFLDLVYLGTTLDYLTSWAAGGSGQSTI